MVDLCNLYAVRSSSASDGIVRVVEYLIRKENPRRNRQHNLDRRES